VQLTVLPTRSRRVRGTWAAHIVLAQTRFANAVQNSWQSQLPYGRRQHSHLA
jgi:hypothetical protein